MEDNLNYFAYGSNINRYILEIERQVKPIQSIVAYLNGYSLTFNVPGLRYLEPCFANIQPMTGSQVWGICHKISRSDFEKIRATEGTTYKVINVEVKSMDSTNSISAITFSSDIDSTVRLWPSKRYLNILISGAHHYKLPSEYIAELQSTRCHHIPFLSSAFNLALKAAKPIYFFLKRK